MLLPALRRLGNEECNTNRLKPDKLAPHCHSNIPVNQVSEVVGVWSACVKSENVCELRCYGRLSRGERVRCVSGENVRGDSVRT